MPIRVFRNKKSQKLCILLKTETGHNGRTYYLVQYQNSKYNAWYYKEDIERLFREIT